MVPRAEAGAYLGLAKTRWRCPRASGFAFECQDHSALEVAERVWRCWVIDWMSKATPAIRKAADPRRHLDQDRARRHAEVLHPNDRDGI
jgi:hypothetical protein